MPDSIEENIRRVLGGFKLDDGEEICDYPLGQQNEIIGSYFFFLSIFNCGNFNFLK